MSRRTKRRLVLGSALAVLTATLLAVAVWLFLVSKVRESDPVDRLAFIKDQVRRRFPLAPQISTDELATRLTSGERLVLLDVRNPEEYAVSHLPGAIRVDPNASPALPVGIGSDVPVVAYCSVGWRSSKWVEALRNQGVDAVNLEGSIFQWVAEDRPLRRGAELVDVVHPYSSAWAWLVDPDDRAYTSR